MSKWQRFHRVMSHSRNMLFLLVLSYSAKQGWFISIATTAPSVIVANRRQTQTCYESCAGKASLYMWEQPCVRDFWEVIVHNFAPPQKKSGCKIWKWAGQLWQIKQYSRTSCGFCYIIPSWGSFLLVNESNAGEIKFLQCNRAKYSFLE